MRESASRGFWVSSYAPFGYNRVMVQDGAKKRPSLQPNPDASHIVKRIFDMAEAGNGMTDITRTLNDEGIASPRGKLWGKTSVHAILINEAYTGTLVWGANAKDNAEPVRVEKAFPAIITKAQFNRVGKLMRARAPKRSHPRRVGSTYLLSGLVKCKACGRALSGQDAKSGQFSYYVCQSIMKRGKNACVTPRLNARRFEQMIVDKIRSNILTEGSITELVRAVDEEMDGIASEQRKRLETIDTELEDVKRRLGRIWNAIETSDIDIADASDRVKEHRERKERLEDAAADARAILSQRRAHLPSAKGVRGGALVGDTTAGKPRPIRFPDDLLRHHHLYVARTRMGKSTLMHHLVTHKMREKAEGRDPDAIVVIDPHTDLVAGLMDRVRLIDLSDETRSPGINLLDTRIFADRDRTADSVVRVAKGLWEQWGPRMQSILEQTVKTLHEANEQVEAERQYTILDGLRLLSNDPFRNSVLAKISDPYLLEWWARDFGSWHRQYRAEALAPVQTRLSYYASSKRARAILGQRRSTIDLRRTIHDGGVLLISTSQGTVGRDVAALVGASILNLVDAVIREQGRLPLRERRGALVVVDEMQSMPGVDYESMLSELGKFGASFVLATQSLAKLDDLSRTMRDTLLANVGCLAVFQVAGNDARTLVWELGKDRVSEDDIVSLPVHHCYVRATVGKERMPAFSMMVRKPEEGDPAVAARIRAAASAYTVPAPQIAYGDAEGDLKVEEFRRAVEDPKSDGEQQQKPEAEPERRRRRSRRRAAADAGEAEEVRE